MADRTRPDQQGDKPREKMDRRREGDRRSYADRSMRPESDRGDRGRREKKPYSTK